MAASSQARTARARSIPAAIRHPSALLAPRKCALRKWMQNQGLCKPFPLGKPSVFGLHKPKKVVAAAGFDPAAKGV